MAQTDPLGRLDPAFALAFQDSFFRPPPQFSEDDLSTLERFVKVAGLQPEGIGGRKFNLDRFPYLRDLYAEQRANPFRRIVIMKAAQMGLTVRLLMRCLWWVADGRKQVNVALFFPSEKAVFELHTSRFRPMAESSVKMMRMADSFDRMGLVRFGVSTMRFRGMRSPVGLDSFPVDVEEFDEVRLMPTSYIQRAFVRLSESQLRGPHGEAGIIELNSTAGFPNQDIDLWFSRSDMNYWRTPCPNPACKRSRTGIIMPLRWPDVVGRDGSRLYYQCPDCKTEIPDSWLMSKGFYVPERPGAKDEAGIPWRGYQFSQILKGNKFLPELWGEYQRGDNMAEFYNSRLGLPYQDRTAIPATRDVVLACKDPAYRWPTAQSTSTYRAMGVDQRGVEKHVCIYDLGPDGRYYLAHLEVIEASGQDAVKALVSLARRFRVDIVVIDGEPSYDLAVGLGRHPDMPRGSVWLADYVEDAPQMIEWPDDRAKKSIAKGSGETKYEFRVLIDRYKGMDWALTKFERREMVLPVDFEAKVQSRTRRGQTEVAQVGQEYLLHLENIARVSLLVTRKTEQGERFGFGHYRRTFRHLNVDPHFAHAHLFACVGLSRRAGVSNIYYIYYAQSEPALEPQPQTPTLALPSTLQPERLEAEKKLSRAKTCGMCKHFVASQSRCGHPANRAVILKVEQGTPSCLWFAAARKK